MIRTGEKNFPNLFTERWRNVLKREKLRWSERDHLFLWSCWYYRRSWFWPASLFLMRRQPNVSDLERSWKPLINKEQKTLFKLQSERSKKFYSPQLQSSKNIVPTKSNRTSKLFFWYSERQHCLSLQYTMLASHIHKVETECAIIHALFMLVCLNYVAWIEFSCGVRFAIYLCINFPILQNICFVDLMYFLILCWGVMKIWTVWFFILFYCISTSHALLFFFLQNLLRSMNNSVDLGLFLSSGRFGKFSKW